MQVDEKLIAYLEDLSYLVLSEEEKARLSADLNEILAGMARLGELDTDGVAERSHPFDNTNAFREDAVSAFGERELILKNAPERDEDMFIAPRAVE